jgi:hypothetical protein
MLLRAYLAAALGDFAEAERLARRTLRSTRLDPASAVRASVTLGSVLRQTGRHAAARVVESAALRRARRPEDRAHLLIGLAADAVGLGDLAAVNAALRTVPATRQWRVRVRLAWVRSERELLAGRPEAAARHARAAVVLSEREHAARHTAKSHLFLGAALLDAAQRRSTKAGLREARRSLRRARSVALRIGAGPIAAVADDLLARVAL